MDKIILIGGGGHCKACIDVIEEDGRFQIVGIVDVKDKVGQKVLNYEIIAIDDDLPRLAKEFRNFFITIGQIKSPNLRIEKYNLLKQLNVNLPSIISPAAYVSKNANIEEGTIIMHKAFVNAGAKIGENCIINTGTIIEHDVIIEDNCHISTGAIINGGTVVRRNSFVGSNAMAKEYIEVGEDCIISGGGVVMRNLQRGTVVKAKI